MTDHTPPRHIVLIGFRGSGKSTVGANLAQRLSRPFIDTDELIVARAGMAITQLFANEGESGFRHRESEVMREIIEREPSVISLGGGAVLNEAEIARLAADANVIHLSTSARVLKYRIEVDDQSEFSRPPLTASILTEEIDALLARRLPLYRRWATHTIDTDSLSPDEIAHEIASLLEPNSD